MARFSTGAVNAMGAHKSYKEATIGQVLRVYTGVQPTTADVAVSGYTLLALLTLAGGAYTGIPSTKQVDKWVVSSYTEAQVFKIVIDGVAYSYTALAGSSNAIVAAALGALVEESDVVSAVVNSDTVITRARFGGNAYTTATTGTTGSLALTNLIANARTNGLQWGAVADGVLSKESGVWQGNGIVDGNAGWARLSAYGDAGALSTTEIRTDFSVSAVSGDILLRTTAVYAGVPVVINSGSMTFPKQRT